MQDGHQNGGKMIFLEKLTDAFEHILWVKKFEPHTVSEI